MKDVTKTDLLRLSGRVVNAPADAADGNLAVFDGAGGKALKDSGIGAGMCGTRATMGRAAALMRTS